MNAALLKLALSGKMPLQLDYPADENGESLQPAAIDEPLYWIEAELQIADAFAWLLHVI
jgi:hypothetical protein